VFQCLTLNHRATPPRLRERFSLSGDALRSALQTARHTKGIERLVILSTCQRLELYSAHPAGVDTSEQLIEWLSEQTDLSAAEIRAHATYLTDVDAARHLHRVATGLDATLLGEAQILSQVAGAIRTAVAEHAASPALKTLFRSAVQAGERARGTVWSKYARSDIGSVALERVTELRGTLAGQHAVVVGAGEVGELALRALRSHGVTVSLINRTIARGIELGEQFGATVHGLAELPALMHNADIVFVATSAPRYVVDEATVRHVMHDRQDRTLTIIDASMPRNADPAVRTLNGVTLVDLDDLEPSVARARAARENAIPAVEAIIESEIGSLVQRYAHGRVAAEPERRWPPSGARTRLEAQVGAHS
jgi:glutamyl-tRNA reductase